MKIEEVLKQDEILYEKVKYKVKLPKGKVIRTLLKFIAIFEGFLNELIFNENFE